MGSICSLSENTSYRGWTIAYSIKTAWSGGSLIVFRLKIPLKLRIRAAHIIPCKDFNTPRGKSQTECYTLLKRDEERLLLALYNAPEVIQVAKLSPFKRDLQAIVKGVIRSGPA